MANITTKEGITKMKLPTKGSMTFKLCQLIYDNEPITTMQLREVSASVGCTPMHSVVHMTSQYSIREGDVLTLKPGVRKYFDDLTGQNMCGNGDPALPRYAPPFREMNGYTKSLTQGLRVPIRTDVSFKALTGGAYFNHFED